MLRSVAVLLLAGATFGHALAEQPGPQGEVYDPGKDYLKKYVGKVRAELLFDDSTGILTYQLRNISDEPVRIHMESLEGVEIRFSIEPDVDSKVKVDSGDEVNPEANVKTLPYGVKPKLVSASDAGERLKEQAEKEKDRFVKLNKDEAVSRSFYLYDTPWFNALVKKLETKKFKAYRIDPSPFIRTADSQGKPVTDHLVEVWNWEDAHAGKFNRVYHTGGLVLDLAKIKKIQALMPVEKKGEKEKK